MMLGGHLYGHLVKLVWGDESLVGGWVAGAVEAVWSDTVKFQADTCGAGPRVCGGGVAFDLSPSASFAGAHHFEALVAVMLVNEDIVFLHLALLLMLLGVLVRGECEGGHCGELEAAFSVRDD